MKPFNLERALAGDKEYPNCCSGICLKDSLSGYDRGRYSDTWASKLKPFHGKITLEND
jgi:hypothetical protein